MTERLIDIDDDLLDEASEALGTTGESDTVRAALRYAADAGARSRHVQWLREGDLAEMREPKARRSVWR